MSKMVQLANDAYELLKEAKRPNESFSDVVRRWAPKPKPLNLTGLRSKKEIDAAEKLLREIDEFSRHQEDERRQRMAGR